MNFFMDILRGVVIGVANIIPGVSGGTMMVTMGIYDRLLEAINGLFKHFIKSVKTLLPVVIGMLVGIAGFAVLLKKVLFAKCPLPTAFAFIGLIVGGIPLIVSRLQKAGKAAEAEENKSEKKKEAPFGLKLVIFALFFALIIGMQFMGEGAAKELKPSVLSALLLLFLGVLASAAMVIPGVSGSLLLMAMGYYNAIIAAINDFLDALKKMDFAAMIDQCLLLVPFGIGVLLGIFFVAKLITWLLTHHEKLTYYGILGLVVASPFPVFMGGLENTKLMPGGIPVAVDVRCIIGCVVTFAVGTVVGILMSKE